LDPNARAIFDAAKLGAINTKWSTEDNLLKADVNKSYPSVLVNNTDGYCTFSINDDFKPFVWNPEEDIPDGFFIIEKPIAFSWFPVPLKRVLYPTNLVKYSLNYGAISRDDISQWIQPTRVLRADLFKDATNTLFENVNADAARFWAFFSLGCLDATRTESTTRS
jgi:hypothetical protein